MHYCIFRALFAMKKVLVLGFIDNRLYNPYSSDLLQFYIIVNYITKKISITIINER